MSKLSLLASLSVSLVAWTGCGASHASQDGSSLVPVTPQQALGTELYVISVQNSPATGGRTPGSCADGNFCHNAAYCALGNQGNLTIQEGCYRDTSHIEDANQSTACWISMNESLTIDASKWAAVKASILATNPVTLEDNLVDTQCVSKKYGTDGTYDSLACLSVGVNGETGVLRWAVNKEDCLVDRMKTLLSVLRANNFVITGSLAE